MFQDFLESVLVRGKFRGGNFALGKQAKRSEFFFNFPPCPPKKRGTLEQNFFLLCNQGFARLFLFHEVGTNSTRPWNTK